MDTTLAVPRALTSIEDVYRVHYPRLWRSLLAYTADSSIAEDAIAEAFAQALRRGPAIRDPERWVWRTAYRIAAGSLKDRRRHREPGPEPSYEVDDEPAWLLDAIARLPAGQRGAIILHYYADLPVRDVADVLGLSTVAVKVSLMRGRRRLRSLLEVPHG